MNVVIRILFLSTVLFGSTSLFAQYPSGLYNEDLRDWVKANSYDTNFDNLGYTLARQEMYSFTDEQDGLIYCIYTGFSQAASYTTFPDPINTEHIVPQSLFGSAEPMRSDIHVIRPSHNNSNSTRGVLPFGEVLDTQAQWIGIDQFGQYVSTSIQPTNDVGFSEYDINLFEPKENAKGDIARQLFYFFTMYPTQAGTIQNVADINVLYQWHLQDPVDAAELTRNDRIETVQGNRNPYIDYSSLAFDAWMYTSSCAEPLALNVSEISTEGASLLWQEAGTATSWKLEYGEEGFSQGSGTLVSVLEPSYELQGLNSNTGYDFYVQANCNPPDGDSYWAGPFTFMTLPNYCAGDVFTDSGGLSGNYSSQEDAVYALCPDDTVTEKVTLTFTSVDIAVSETGLGTQDGCWDFLTIYNGADTLSPVLAETLCGEFEESGQVPSVPSSLLLSGDAFTSTSDDGCLTVRFRSDDIFNEAGWSANISCGPLCTPPSELDVVEIGFGGSNARVNAVWNNPNETVDCEVRGGRISPSSIQSGVPEFANINNTQLISQTDGTTVDFNIVLFNNPNVPFVIGQTYGYEVRCLCSDLIGYSDWSGISTESTFVVPVPPGIVAGNSGMKVNSSRVSAYPNPSAGDFMVLEFDSIEKDETLKCEISDLLGRTIEVHDFTLTDGDDRIRISFEDELQNGIYSLSVTGRDGLKAVLPFLVQ